MNRAFPAFLVLLALAGPASAQEPTPLPGPAADEDPLARAKELYENGSRLYDEGLYEDAIVAFQEAYRLSQRPGLLFNIANCYERLGKLQSALDSLNSYRAFAKAEERESIERRIVALERRITDQKLAAPPVAAVAPVVVAAPAPAVAPAPARKLRSAPLAVVGAALGVAGGAAAGITYAQSRTYVDSGDQEAYEALRPLNGGALGLSAVGLGLFVVGVLPGPKASDLALSVSPGRDAGRVTLSGQF